MFNTVIMEYNRSILLIIVFLVTYLLSYINIYVETFTFKKNSHHLEKNLQYEYILFHINKIIFDEKSFIF